MNLYRFASQILNEKEFDLRLLRLGRFQPWGFRFNKNQGRLWVSEVSISVNFIFRLFY